jgi:hypothetical protein
MLSVKFEDLLDNQHTIVVKASATVETVAATSRASGAFRAFADNGTCSFVDSATKQVINGVIISKTYQDIIRETMRENTRPQGNRCKIDVDVFTVMDQTAVTRVNISAA